MHLFFTVKLTKWLYFKYILCYLVIIPWSYVFLPIYVVIVSPFWAWTLFTTGSLDLTGFIVLGCTPFVFPYEAAKETRRHFKSLEQSGRAQTVSHYSLLDHGLVEECDGKIRTYPRSTFLSITRFPTMIILRFQGEKNALVMESNVLTSSEQTELKRQFL